MTTLIDFFEQPNQHIGAQEATQVPRVGDEMSLIPREAKRAFMYKVVRVVWAADLRQPMQEYTSALTGHAVDVFLERV